MSRVRDQLPAPGTLLILGVVFLQIPALGLAVAHMVWLCVFIFNQLTSVLSHFGFSRSDD